MLSWIFVNRTTFLQVSRVTYGSIRSIRSHRLNLHTVLKNIYLKNISDAWMFLLYAKKIDLTRGIEQVNDLVYQQKLMEGNHCSSPWTLLFKCCSLERRWIVLHRGLDQTFPTLKKDIHLRQSCKIN
jgi:hypothetical protein